MKLPRAQTLLPLLAAILASCAHTEIPADQDKPEPAADNAPKVVGRIASIQSEPRFVLIQSYGPWEVEAGTILTTRGGDGRTANLLATGESAGQFAAADIRAGAVEIGDAVLTLPTPDATLSSPDPVAHPQDPATHPQDPATSPPRGAATSSS